MAVLPFLGGSSFLSKTRRAVRSEMVPLCSLESKFFFFSECELFSDDKKRITNGEGPVGFLVCQRPILYGLTHYFTS